MNQLERHPPRHIQRSVLLLGLHTNYITRQKTSAISNANLHCKRYDPGITYLIEKVPWILIILSSILRSGAKSFIRSPHYLYPVTYHYTTYIGSTTWVGVHPQSNPNYLIIHLLFL